MPELPEVEAVRRDLEPAMQGARFERVLFVAQPAHPVSQEFCRTAAGTRSVRADAARQVPAGGALLGGDTDHPSRHVGFFVSSDRRNATAGSRRVTTTSCSDVVRRDSDVQRCPALRPDGHRRARQLERYPALSAMGPEPLSAEFDAATLARACRGKRVAFKVALIDQQVVAGLGNIYASEALHRAHLSPRRRASTIATATGAPREPSRRLWPPSRQC